jgi:RHS repeat-associated protein
LASIGPDGLQTRTIIDAAGRTLKTITNFTGDGIYDPQKPDENITTEMRYDIAGNLIWQKDPLGHITQKEYDKLGRLIATIAPNNGRTSYEYNTGGEMISVTDPMGRTTRFEYGSFGRRVKTILPKPSSEQDNPVEETVYNELGQVIAQIDPLGHTTRFEYNELGQKIRHIDANSDVTEFVYDDEGKLLSLTDPVGNTTRYEYDEFDRVIKETNELGKSRTFEYLLSGLLAEKTDRNKRTTCFKYNRFGQILEECWLNGKRTINRIYFEYNKLGQIVNVNDHSGSFGYDYDIFGHRKTETINFVGLKDTITFRNSFDILGRRIENTVNVGQKEDNVMKWTYNNLGHVVTISQDNKRVEYSYNLAGQRSKIEAKGVYYSEWTYDPMGHLAGIDYRNPLQETLAKYDLTWDTAGRIVTMNLNGELAQYSYDVTNQLTDATYEKLPKESYQYDSNGNRKNFLTGKNNQLTNDNVFKYTYDAEGNRISKISKKSRTDYFWDHHNRLVKVVADGKMVEYVYDYQNRLVKRNDVFFVHDGWQVVCSLKNGKIVDRYLWGARQDELLCENDHWTLCDHLGTIREIINENGKTVSHLDYSAFGELLNVSGIKPKFRYTGKMFDDVTGLQWNINRWYDASVGRWISEDPIGFEGQDANFIRYNSNSPLDRLDVFGLWKLSIENGRYIFTAETSDTFPKLVKLIADSGTITLTSKNKVCIRPYPYGVTDKIAKGMKKNWEKEKPFCGGKYDATSLYNAIPSPAQTSGNFSIGNDEMAPDPINRGYINSAGNFYHSTNIATATGVAGVILQLASKGDTPIRSLILVGHGNSGSLFIGGFNDGGSFSFYHLYSHQADIVPSQPFEWMKWDWAVNMQKALPVGCWFSTNAHVRLVGCLTEDMAKNAAEKFVRKSASVFGTTKYTASSETPGEWMAFWEGRKGDRLTEKHYTPEDYNTDRRWEKFDGEN